MTKQHIKMCFTELKCYHFYTFWELILQQSVKRTRIALDCCGSIILWLQLQQML